MTHFIETHQSPDEHWQSFIQTGSHADPGIRDVILQSWLRCQTHGVAPYNNDLHPYLQGDRLTRALQQRERLITVARPFMDDLYSLVQGTGFVVVLTNEEGYILQMFSDEDAAETPMTSNFFIGASWRETDAGTNAIGTALKEQRPVQVSGAEHFYRKHHCLTCSAAPIFDPDDKLLGILDISGACESAHLHTLGMVVAAAKAIIAQLRIRKKNHQLAVANKKLINFFNMVSDGVLILDRDGRVTELNPAAQRIFGKSRTELTGHRMTQLLTNDETSCKGGLVIGQSRSETELLVDTVNGPCPCLASTEPVVNE